jgi:hypothetical protein
VRSSDRRRELLKLQVAKRGSSPSGRGSETQQTLVEKPALAITPLWWKRSYCVKPAWNPSSLSRAAKATPERPTKSRAPARPPTVTL